MGCVGRPLFPPEQARTPIGRRPRPTGAAPCSPGPSRSRPTSWFSTSRPTISTSNLDLLQELLGDYAGTILIVSHDRDFLDRVATSVVVGEGDGRWVRDPRAVIRTWWRSAAMAWQVRSLPRLRQRRRPRDSRPNGPRPKRKLGFNERRALETLPRRIEKLRADLDGLESKLADIDFPAREPAAFASATRAYGELREELTGAEDEWLGLEILREDIEQRSRASVGELSAF